MSIPFTQLVRSLPATTPFVGPEAIERSRGARFRARIGANESAFGISRLALSAMQDELQRSSWYADPESYQLREALAQKHGVSMDEICVDAGIDSLLGLTVRMLMEPGATVATSQGAYPTLNYHVAGFGGQLHLVPYQGFHEDPDALLSAAKQTNAALVYLSNPDNPMGTWHSRETVAAMMDGLPETTVMLLDEAYIEFAETDIAPPIDTDNPQVIRFRTFSKAYGMAGQRVGYAIANREIITGFNKIRNHFGLNRIAQVGAQASLADSEFLPSVNRAVRVGREKVMRFAAERNLYAAPSYTNFVAVDLGTCERAQAMIGSLAEHDVFMRMPGAAPLNRCIRIGIGSEEEFDIFCQSFDKISDQR